MAGADMPLICYEAINATPIERQLNVSTLNAVAIEKSLISTRWALDVDTDEREHYFVAARNFF